MRLVDMQGRVVACSDAYTVLTGLSREQLIGQNLTVVYHPDARKQMLHIFKKGLKNGTLPEAEQLKLRLWDGRILWLDIRHTHLAGKNSDPFLWSSFRDISKIKKAQKIRRESDKRLRLLFDQAADAIFITPANDNLKPLTFSEVNATAYKRLLYSKAEMAHFTPYSIIPYNYHTKMDTALKKLQKEDTVIFQVPLLRKDKRRLPVEISIRRFKMDDANAIIWITRDITQRKQVEKRLKETSSQLRDLASRIQTVREEERTMIAREIHDELGQVLTVLKIQLSLSANKLLPEQQELKTRLESTFGLLDHAVEAVQQISAKLRPGILDELGLAAAVEWQAQDFEKHTGIHCKCSLPSEPVALSAEKNTAVFRIFQEALTNAARHANADRVSIFLKNRNNKLVLEIIDNGCGINKTQINSPKSLGILGMRERVVVLGGSMEINSVPGKGTHIKVTMPRQ